MGADATQPRNRLGAFAARANNTVYQESTDGFIVGLNINDTPLEILIDESTNPPTTQRQYDNAAGVPDLISLFCSVPKNWYWKIVGAATVWFVPLEP